MIDVAGLPQPADAPTPGSCVRVEHPEPGLAVLVLAPPHRKLAVFDVPLLRDLELALAEVASTSGLRGLVIAGREPLAFCAGADLALIESVADAALARHLAHLGQDVFERLARLGRERGGALRTVVAAGGAVPGGACELALACDRIVLADHAKTRIGLPETRLGILPGWGGCERLPRRIGVPAALDVILAGKLLSARAALRLGLADRLTAPEYLRAVAASVALGREEPRRRARGAAGVLVDRNPLARVVVARAARRKVRAQTGGHYPAPLEALALVVAAPGRTLAQGFAAEAEALGRLATTPVTKSLVALFRLTEDAKELARLADGTRAPAIASAGVIGAGVMGAEIASLIAAQGVAVRLADLAQEQLDAAQHAHRAWIARQLARRKLRPNEADAALDRLAVGRDARLGFARCELVLEAVAERLDVKRAVLGAAAAAAGKDALLATNTSSLSVAEIAAGLPGPERVVGIHFFNPARRMPLVEIVRGPATSDATVARAARFALDLGKTPVVVADVAGFLVNRLLGPYLDEAVRLFEAGADIDAVDRALLEFGMPMGPFRLLDEVGLDIAAHAAESLARAYGERMLASVALAPLVERGSLGKKSGTGFRTWEGSGPRAKPRGTNPALPRPAPGPAAALSAAEIADRLVLCMLNEAARCVAERVVSGPRELDLATVLGMGFAPFRGGLLRYADARGAADVVATLSRIRASPAVAGRAGGGARFEPAPLLVELARTGRRFHDAPA